MFFDYFLISVRNLKSRSTRTWLTMIGIFIGIAAIVALVALGQGLKVAINDQFSQMGVDKLIIAPGSGGLYGAPPGGTAVILDDDDLKILRGTQGIKDASGMIYGVAGVKFNDKVKYGWIFGLPQDESKNILMSMSNINILEGRDLREADKNRGLVGRMFYDGTTFGEPVKIGNKLQIGNTSIRVVGYFSPIGNPDDDSTVWLPYQTAAALLGKANTYDMVIAQVHEGQDVDEAAERVKKNLARHRGVKAGDEDFSVSTTEELLESFGVILDAVSIVFIGIASISLIVGGIGIMNTMYTSVMERTSEIGIMKAIGARNQDILFIFLFESGLLGAAGGAIGIAIGYGLSKGIEQIMVAALGVEYLKAYFPAYLIIGALAFSFLVGSVSGVLPAYRASKLKPADALRWE
jgi:putative ABC transport system permease protein